MLQGIMEHRRDVVVCGVLTGLMEERFLNILKITYVIKMTVNAGPNCVKKLFCNTSTLVEQPLLLYIVVTVVWSE